MLFAKRIIKNFYIYKRIMKRKRLHYILEQKIIHILEQEKEKLTLTPEQFKMYLNAVEGNGDYLFKLRNFKNKEVFVDGDLNISNTNTTSLGPLSYVNGKLNIKNSKLKSLGNVVARMGIVGGDYLILKSYVETGNEELLKDLISDSKVVDEYKIFPDRLETEIFLSMDDETFYQMCNLSDDDVWFLNTVNNSYHSYNFYDTDSAVEDFKEGYIYHHFDDENIEKLIDILKLISPNLKINNKEDLIDKSKEVFEILDYTFGSELSDIVSEFTYEKDGAITKEVQNEIDTEMTGVFDNYGLQELRKYNEYKIEVGKLIKLFEEYGENISIYQLFKEISDKELTFPYFVELQYQVDYGNEFDSSSFNRWVNGNLEKIEEKITEGGFENLEEYNKILDEIGKKFEFGEWYVLPKDSSKERDKQTQFKINNVDLQTNLISVTLDLPNEKKYKTVDYSLEEYNLLLYHPELFESKKFC